MGDIISIVDENGLVVVNFEYDTWGKVISITGSLANTIGILNPIRYRSYYYDGSLIMNKRYLKIVVAVLLTLVFFTAFFVIGRETKKVSEIDYGAKYIYDNNGDSIGIEYKSSFYVRFEDEIQQYDLVDAETLEKYEEIYIERNDSKKLSAPVDYFVFYSNIYDDNDNFIVVNPDDSSLQTIYVKDEFVYPTIDENEVDEVWMSLSSTYNIIEDSNTVNHILECAKSNGELSLDEDVYKQIKSTSWDNHCFYLKYKGYPLVEEFHIEETEDGRYIVDR